MARYHLVQIGSFYFTKDGTIAGKQCRLDVDGLDGKKLTKVVQITKDSEGNAYLNITEGASVPITIVIEYLLKATFDSLVTLIQNTLNSETTVTVNITGDTGTFALTCFFKAIRFKKFSNGYIDGVTIELETT